MPRIRTDLLTAGMVVSRDVANIDGMLLIPSGTTLTERQVGILQAWGVTDVEVQASEAAPELDPLARMSPEAVAALKSELRKIFWRTSDSDPVFLEILQVLLRRRARKGATPLS